MQNKITFSSALSPQRLVIYFLKAAKILAVSALALAGGAAALAFFALAIFFAGDSWRLGSAQLRYIFDKAAVAGIEASWSDASLSFKKDGWLAKDVRFSARDLCVEYRKPAVKTCFEGVDFGAKLGLKNAQTGAWLDVPEKIFPMVISGGGISANLDALPASAPTPAAKKSSSFDELRKKLLPRWAVDGSRVELRSIAIDSGARKWRGAVTLQTASQGNPDFLRVDLINFRDDVARFPSASGYLTLNRSRSDASEAFAPLPVASKRNRPADTNVASAEAIAASGSASNLAAKKALATPKDNVPSENWSAQLSLLARLGSLREAHVFAKAQARAWNDVAYDIHALFEGFGPLENAQLRGEFRGRSPKTATKSTEPASDQLSGLLSLKAGSAGPTISAATLVDCAYFVNLTKKAAGVQCGKRAARIDIREAIAPPSLRGNADLFILRPTFDFKALDVRFGQAVSADLVLSMAIRQKGFCSLQASGSGHVQGKSVSDLTWSATGLADLDVPDFETIGAFLRKTPYALPAPINQLAGPIRGHASVQIGPDGGRAPFSLALNLASPDETVAGKIKGEVELIHSGDSSPPNAQTQAGWSGHVHVDVGADDLRISAPRIALKTPPQVTPDARFTSFALEDLKRASSPQAPGRFTLRADAATNRRDAIQIATNMTSAPLPISLDLQTGSRTKNESLRGSVAIDRTPIKFLRRDAHIEQLRVDFLPGGGKRIDGRLSVNYPDYDITVYVKGDASAPQLRFESVPPLPQNKILAALLFGRPLNELSDDEQSSAANMNAAVADAALNFSSLYFLADTPIQSIGYDSDKGLVTADMGIGGGNTLEIGTGSGDAAEVGIRRRLTRNLVLNTYVERVGDTDEKIVSAFVEWVKKF